jgi:osmotically-inducible protein OsmY
LTGTVDSAVKAAAAQAAAHRVAGVLDVANDLVVKLPADRAATDTEIALGVRRALLGETLVPDELIRSTVTGGIVTLEGTVPYLSQRYDAERAVGRLAGVKGVANLIEVRPAERVTAPLRGDDRA